MRQVILALMLAATGLAFSYAGASAQHLYKPDADVDVDFYVVPDAADSVPKPTGARVYSYYQTEPGFHRPQRPGGCGTYFYWNGEHCADARDKR
jgi:hypothetical protein